MFEDLQKITETNPVKRFFTVMGSMVLHTIAIVIVIVLPLLAYTKLPQSELLTFLIAPPPPPPAPPPPPPPPTSVRAAPKVAVVDPTQFVAPTEMPKNIPAPTDDAPVVGVSNIAAGIPGGVSGGVSGGVASGVIGGLLSSAGAAAAPPPPPKPVKREPVRIGGNIKESLLIRQVKPEYPELAKRARIQDTVILVVTVDEEGNVTDVKIQKGHPLLNDAAVNAVKQWKYTPTVLNGEPVPITGTVNVVFRFK